MTDQSGEMTLHYTRFTCRPCCHKHLGPALERFVPGAESYGKCAACHDVTVLPVAAYWYPWHDDEVTS